MSLFGRWFGRNKDRQVDMTKRPAGRPELVDKTGGLVANSKTLNGLYYGTDVDTQFAAPLAFTFLTYICSLAGWVALGHRARHCLHQSQYLLAALCLVGSIGAALTIVEIRLSAW